MNTVVHNFASASPIALTVAAATADRAAWHAALAGYEASNAASDAADAVDPNSDEAEALDDASYRARNILLQTPAPDWGAFERKFQILHRTDLLHEEFGFNLLSADLARLTRTYESADLSGDRELLDLFAKWRAAHLRVAPANCTNDESDAFSDRCGEETIAIEEKIADIRAAGWAGFGVKTFVAMNCGSSDAFQVGRFDRDDEASFLEVGLREDLYRFAPEIAAIVRGEQHAGVSIEPPAGSLAIYRDYDAAHEAINGLPFETPEDEESVAAACAQAAEQFRAFADKPAQTAQDILIKAFALAAGGLSGDMSDVDIEVAQHAIISDVARLVPGLDDLADRARIRGDRERERLSELGGRAAA